MEGGEEKIEINLSLSPTEVSFDPGAAGSCPVGSKESAFLSFFRQLLAIAEGVGKEQNEQVLEADPGRDRGRNSPPGIGFVPEIFPGLLLLLDLFPPLVDSAPGELPAGKPESNLPKILGSILNDAGSLSGDLPPVEAVRLGVNHLPVFQTLLLPLLPLPDGTALRPPVQAETSGADVFGIPPVSAGPGVQPGELLVELKQLSNLFQELLLPYRQGNTAGLSKRDNLEGKIETVNSFRTPGFLEVLAAQPELKEAGFSASEMAKIRQWRTFLLQLGEQISLETFRGQDGWEDSGERSSRVKPGPGPAVNQTRVPVEIVRQDGSPPVAQNPGSINSGPRGEQILQNGSVYRPNLAGAPFQIEKDAGTSAQEKNFALLTFNLSHHGGGVTGMVQPGSSQGGVSLLQMPALVVQVLQAAGRRVPGETHLRFRLEPEHLGEITIRLIYQHGEVSAHFLAGNLQTKEAIENSLPQLREALAGQNLHLQNVSVSVGQEGDRLLRENYGQTGYNYPRRGSGSGGAEADRTGAGLEAGAEVMYGRVNLCI